MSGTSQYIYDPTFAGKCDTIDNEAVQKSRSILGSNAEREKVPSTITETDHAEPIKIDTANDSISIIINGIKITVERAK